jgi:hypothetical protein
MMLTLGEHRFNQSDGPVMGMGSMQVMVGVVEATDIVGTISNNPGFMGMMCQTD